MIPRLLALFGFVLFAAPSWAEEGELTLAISPDIPPYVMDGASSGLEVDIVRRALPGRKLRFVQMPYGEIETAVQDGRADAAVSVHRREDGVFYSNNYIAFANFAISRTSDELTIGRIRDLNGHPVLTWQGAWSELGPEFAAMFAPGAPQHADCFEFANQKEQVQTFWKRDGSVAVIDGSIFRYFSEQMGHAPATFVLHPVFPPVTDFRVGFKDAANRDAFNAGLAELCLSGTYAALLKRYQVVLERSPCDG